MSERKKNIGIICLSFGNLLFLLEIVGFLTGTFVGPLFLYLLVGVLEGVGIVFFLSGFTTRVNYIQNTEMM